MGPLRTILFIAAVAFTAFLLFWLEPMVGKLLLPTLGGSPSVWNVCMVVYQLALLAGYLIALLLARLPFRQQLIGQFTLLAAAGLTLPIRFDPEQLSAIGAQDAAALRLTGALFWEIGLPFVALATVSPLLQAWWARSAPGREPYFLYAASNAGSFLGLLGYPIWIERLWPLGAQRTGWSIGFAMAAGLILLAGLAGRRPVAAVVPQLDMAPSASAVAPSKLLVWAGLAFIPSSLTLGVTSFLSSDVASLPLLWVIPLAVYLLTFVLAFGLRSQMAVLDRVMPPLAIGLLFLWLIGATEPPWLLFSAHLAFLFLASLICHKRLALLRPHPEHLTVFYLALAVGGALGGLFNSLLAPALFNSVAEYPLAILLATAIRINFPPQNKSRWRWAPFAAPVFLGLVAFALAGALKHLDELDARLRLVMVVGIPLFAAFFLSARALPFAAALALIALASRFAASFDNQLLYAERNFFGVSRVIKDPKQGLHTYYHGTTIHGVQTWNPDPACDPLAYYAFDGPLGHVFRLFRNSGAPGNIAAVGLGAGAVAAYSHEGDLWTFYEIDPAVVRIAQNGFWFTYLRDCARVPPQIVLGDARLKLQEAPERQFGLIILDAFSSDAIPTHLLTREAFELYLSRLSQEGMIACHISSRHLDLKGPLAALGRDLGLHGAQREDPGGSSLAGTFSSNWVVLSRKAELIERLKAMPPPYNGAGPWIPLTDWEEARVWTDDYTDILSVITFR